MFLTLKLYSLKSSLSIEIKIMHIDLIIVDLFLINFGYVCLGKPHLQKPSGLRGEVSTAIWHALQITLFCVMSWCLNPKYPYITEVVFFFCLFAFVVFGQQLSIILLYFHFYPVCCLHTSK